MASPVDSMNAFSTLRRSSLCWAKVRTMLNQPQQQIKTNLVPLRVVFLMLDKHINQAKEVA